MSSRKRKFRSKKTRADKGAHDSQDPAYEPDPALFIHAYEVDLVHGSQAKIAAAALEVAGAGAGSGLIRWGEDAAQPKPSGKTGSLNISDDSSFQNESTDILPNIWVDRYDARLLLESLPSQSGAAAVTRPISPSGWSDLPSDAEDTFFLDPEEIESYNRDKRRRVLDRDREARLRALQELEISNGIEEEEPWGGSDEEPEDDQKELMRRTAKHIVTSPNAAQLEMRILANHGGDKRFAFLRGRWKLAWKVIKGRAKIEKSRDDEAGTKPADQKSSGLGGLTGYGDSDDEDEGSGADETEPTDVPNAVAKDEEALKELRRQKAKEWAQKRRESKSS